MNIHYSARTDTICSPATGPGPSAIGVIRVSGPHSWELSSRHFEKLKKHSEPGKVILGNWKDEQGWVDQVLVLPFRGPKSFNGEDIVEISYHGSSYIERRILHNLMDAGCRMAEPGEFSFRAFRNGKMGLHETEAIAELISSSSAAGHKVAQGQMNGQFTLRLKTMRDALIKASGLVELELDFSEEDVEFASRKDLYKQLLNLGGEIKQLEQSFRYGRGLKKGIPVAIVGAPNAGKSTLLNALLNENRAIVSDIPGTTRDTIEEVIEIEGVLFRFIDTAGLRKTEDTVEQMGIERTQESIRQAQIIIVLQDGRDFLKEKSTWFHTLYEAEDLNPGAELIFAFSKSDLVFDAIPSDLFSISAHSGSNIPELKKKLLKACGHDKFGQSEVVLTQARHAEALKLAQQAIIRAMNAISNGYGTELLAEELRMVRYHIGSIAGEIVEDDLLDMIFREFCIGK